MHISRIRYGLTIPYVLTFTLCLAACGCNHKDFGHGKGKDSFVCGDQTVTVVPVDGTSPKDVYLCEGDTLTWQPNGHTFVVTFAKKYPFEGSPMTFQNDPQDANKPVVSRRAKHIGSLVVYHYDMTVDNVSVSDPQVVGGGGHSN